MFPLADGGVTPRNCTGVIVAPTKVLTAAHCRPNASTIAMLYPTTLDGGDTPTGVNLTASQTHPVDYPPGVSCDGEVDGGFPGTCFSCDGGVGCDSTNGFYADLAVVSLSDRVPAPYQMTTLGPTGDFATSAKSTLWEVGAGLMNYKANNWSRDASANVPHEMKWVPITLSAGATDSGGSFTSARLYGDPGDSGGPVYQYAAGTGADAGTYNLILVGIVSSMIPPPATNNINKYTSIQYPGNYTWLQSYGGALSGPDVSTFGASR